MKISSNISRGFIIAALAVFLAAGLAMSVTWTNFSNVAVDDLLVNGDSVVSSLGLTFDSLGYNSETATGLWTPDRAVRVLRMDVFSHTATASDTCKVYLRSGTVLTAKTVYIPTSSKSGSLTAGFSIAAAVPCTLFSNDGGIGTGDGVHGKIANMTIQYSPN